MCPDFICNNILELCPVLAKTEQNSRDYFYKMHVKRLSKKDGKDQEMKQLSTTHDPGYHMGK